MMTMRMYGLHSENVDIVMIVFEEANVARRTMECNSPCQHDAHRCRGSMSYSRFEGV